MGDSWNIGINPKKNTKSQKNMSIGEMCGTRKPQKSAVHLF
jgi:hypothetical protein